MNGGEAKQIYAPTIIFALIALLLLNARSGNCAIQNNHATWCSSEKQQVFHKTSYARNPPICPIQAFIHQLYFSFCRFHHEQKSMEIFGNEKQCHFSCAFSSTLMWEVHYIISCVALDFSRNFSHKQNLGWWSVTPTGTNYSVIFDQQMFHRFFHIPNTMVMYDTIAWE